MRPISSVEATLRVTMAAPAMLIAIESGLPKIRAHYEELNMIALVSGRELDMELANSWLTVVLLHEYAVREARGEVKRAVKSAGPVEVPRRVRP